MKSFKKLVVIQDEPYFQVCKGKTRNVVKFYWRERIPWFTLQDEDGSLFERPAK